MLNRLFIPAVAFALLVTSSALWALDLHQAKSQGLVGETATGYIAPVGTATAEVTSLVNDINRQRKAEYERIAAKNNISVKDVEALAAQKAIEKTPAGQYVRTNGQWVRK
ncbi:MAG TPA: YdbL family protein [Porticoccaceae bacterium]